MLYVTALVGLLISAGAYAYLRSKRNRWAGLFQLLMVCSAAYLVVELMLD